MKFNLTPIALAISLVGISLSTKAQEWKRLMSEGAPYSEIVETFEKEWGKKPYERHQGFKPYYRYKNYWKSRLNEKGEIPSKMEIYEAHATYMASFPPVVTGNEDHGFWRTEGPFDHQNTASWSPGQGRVNVVVEDPNDVNTIYVGAPDGGLWKSEDAGSTWSSLIDDFSRLGVSDIAIDPTNSNIIYIATGDADGGDAPSIGIWKSSDGGVTWGQTGSFFANRIYKISIDPDDNTRILTATSNGIFRSLNSGTSWTSVHNGVVKDIQYAYGSGNQLAFAATGTEFIRSTNNGASWTTITNGILTDFDYMEFDITADDSNYIYVVTTGGDGVGSGVYSGVYKSVNAGVSFTQIHNLATDDIFDGSGQAYYDLDIAVDQTDKDVIVVGVLNIWKSTDGGTTWNGLNNWSSPEQASYTHADIHFLKWYNNNLYCGSDGGIYKSTDDGENFTDLTKGLPIGQYYDIEVYQKDPSYMSGGLQDNGGYYFDGSWKCFYGADGMVNVLNQKDSTQLFGMIQYGTLFTSTDAGLSSGGNGTPGIEEGLWVTPMEWDDENDRVIAGYSKLYSYKAATGWLDFSSFTFPDKVAEIELFNNKTNTILAATASDGVFLTTNGGLNWTNVTTNLPFPGNFVKDIEFDESDSSHFFVLQTNNIFETTNSGTTWTNISGTLPSTNFNDIEMDNSETNNSLYLATDVAVHYFNSNLGDWIPYNNNLPNVVVSDIEILSDFDAIRIGTYGRGIYASRLFEKEIHKNDAQIIVEDSSNDTICSAGLSPLSIEFKNRAWDTITELSYEIVVDGVTEVTSTWIGGLLPFQTEIFLAGSINLTAGSHDITYILSNPNGVADSYPQNDTLTKSLFVEGGVDLNTFTIEIQFDGNATKNSWELFDDTGALLESSGGNYPFSFSNTTIKERLCLEDDCFEFKMYDNFANFSGSYKLIDQSGLVIHEQIGSFGAEDVKEFCLPTAIDIPVSNFGSSDTAICFGELIQFADSSINGPVNWTWTFIGGSPLNSNLKNPEILYNNSGTFDVQLIVGNAFGSDTILKTNYIEVSPEIDYNFTQVTDPSLVCQDSVINRLSTPMPTTNLIYEWSDMTGTILSEVDSFVAYTGGDYQFNITDTILGCSVKDTIRIDFGSLEIAFNVIHSQCLGFDNGEVETIITGGSVPYTITWSDTSMHNLNETDLESGVYTITVVDASGCSVTDSVTIENQLVFDVDLEIVNHVICSGGSSGAAKVSISGGQPPYQYEWSNDPLFDVDSMENIPAGDHSVIITDNNGCYVVEAFTIDDGYSLAVNHTKADEGCEGGTDGSISIIPLNGIPPYTYNWSHGLPNQPNVAGLTAGLYSVSVTDGNGCSTNENVTINSQFVFETNYTIIKESCDDESDGEIVANISGGVPPYTLEWLNIAGNPTTASVSGLTSGEYYLSITGANGCDRIDTINMSVAFPIIPLFTPSATAVYLDFDPTISFNNNSIGGSAYSWSFGDGSFSTSHSPSHTYSAVGEYHVTLTVFNGTCSREITKIVNVYPHVGVDEVEGSEFSILPNPNNGTFNILLNASSIKAPNVKIFDIIGREIVSKSIVNNKVSIENLNDGSYIIKLYDEDEFVTLKKMVVN